MYIRSISKEKILVKVKRTLVKRIHGGECVRMSAVYFEMCPKLKILVYGQRDTVV